MHAGTTRAPWGHVSRYCVRCGDVGPRIQFRGGWIHKYCMSPEELAAHQAALPCNRPGRKR